MGLAANDCELCRLLPTTVLNTRNARIKHKYNRNNESKFKELLRRWYKCEFWEKSGTGPDLARRARPSSPAVWTRYSVPDSGTLARHLARNLARSRSGSGTHLFLVPLEVTDDENFALWPRYDHPNHFFVVNINTIKINPDSL